MPIYEYQCSGCGHRFELLVRQSTIRECPSCGSRDLERVVSTFAAGVDPKRPLDAAHHYTKYEH